MSLAFTSRVSLKHFSGLTKCLLNPNFKRSFTSKPNEGKSHTIKAALTGVAIGAIAGGGFSFYQQKDGEIAHVREVQQNNKVASFPKVEISRQIIIPNDATGLNITLFQYPTCPFCCKVRAFLDFYGVSYNVVEVNPVLRQQIKWSSYKKVPILLVKTNDGYMQFNDSSMIVSGLSTYLKDRSIDLERIQEYYPVTYDSENPKKTEIMNKYFIMDGGTDDKTLKRDSYERKWRAWADNVLVHTLSPNVYRTKDEALQAFNWFSEVGEWDRLFSSVEKLLVVYVGALAMWMIGKKLQKKYNLKENVRESLYDECNKWMKEIETSGLPFLGGKEPNLADLAVYGVLCSIEGCDAFRELLENTNIGTWYFRMKEAVKNHEGQKLLI